MFGNLDCRSTLFSEALPDGNPDTCGLFRITEDAMKDETPYAVVCGEHGKQCLSQEQYNAQMRRPDAFWLCPICGEVSDWDDIHYAKFQETPQGLSSHERHMSGPDENEEDDGTHAVAESITSD